VSLEVHPVFTVISSSSLGPNPTIVHGGERKKREKGRFGKTRGEFIATVRIGWGNHKDGKGSKEEDRTKKETSRSFPRKSSWLLFGFQNLLTRRTVRG